MLKRFAVVVALLLVTACSSRKVGDHLMVEWKGSNYPAVIIEVVGGEKYKIHYEGYGNEWDEVVGNDRILGTPK